MHGPFLDKKHPRLTPWVLLINKHNKENVSSENMF